MPPRPFTPGFPIHAFPTSAALSSFLSANHLMLPGFYLKLAKKASQIPTVTFAEATEVALCYGWIDGGGHGIDETWWTVRYTPRRSKSMWSKKNVDTVERLIQEGKMTAAGMEAVEAAKKDGRWERAYAGPATIQEPDDFKAALAKNEKAKTFFASLNSSQRYSVLWRIQTASVKTRAKKIEGFVEMLAEEQLPPLAGETKARRDARAAKVVKPKVMKKSTAPRKKSVEAAQPDSKPIERPIRKAASRARP